VWAELGGHPITAATVRAEHGGEQAAMAALQDSINREVGEAIVRAEQRPRFYASLGDSPGEGWQVKDREHTRAPFPCVSEADAGALAEHMNRAYSDRVHESE